MAGATWGDPIEITVSDDGGDFVQQIDVTANQLQTDDQGYPSADARITWWRYAPGADGTIEFRLNFSNNNVGAGTHASTGVYVAPVDVANKAAMYASTDRARDFQWLEAGEHVVSASFVAEAGFVYIWEVRSTRRDGDNTTPMTVQMIVTGAPASLDYGPTVVLDPFSKTVSVGDHVVMQSLGYGRPMPSLQWQKDHVPEFIGPHDWQDVPGATSSPYFFVASINDDKMRWRAKYTSPRGVVYSQPATLTVTPAPPSNPGDVVLPPTVRPGTTPGTTPVPGEPVPVVTPTPGTGSPVPPSTDTTNSASLLALIREFSSTVQRPVRITSPTSIEMVNPAAPLPSGWTQSEAAALYSSTTRDLKAGVPKLSMKPEDLALLVVGATFKTNDARLLISGWQIPGPLPVFGLSSPAPVQRISLSFTPKSFSASVEFYVGTVPDSLRRH